MAGFHDLVGQAQPAIYGGGFSGGGTEGRSWEWRFIDVNDNAGDPIDLTAVTGSCVLVTAVGGTQVLALTFTGGSGEFTVSADEAATAGLYTGTGKQALAVVWAMTLDNGVDSVQVWGPINSRFLIYPED